MRDNPEFSCKFVISYAFWGDDVTFFLHDYLLYIYNVMKSYILDPHLLTTMGYEHVQC